MPRALADATRPEVERCAAGPALAAPVGSTWQHGPHPALSTDTGIAVALAEELTRRRPGAVGAPAIPYGSSGEPRHAAFPATLSIGRETTELVLVELGRSAWATFSAVVLVCAHGGNRAPVARAEPGVTAPLEELMPRLGAHGVREVSANGILGDPAGAGAAEGRRVLEDGVDQLVCVVDEVVVSLDATAARRA